MQQWKLINYCSKHMVKMQWVVHKCLNRRVPHLQDQRRGARCEAKQRSCYWHLFDSEGIIHHQCTPDGQTTTNSTWRSCNACVNLFAENDRKNGRMVTGSCTTTMHLHTLHICTHFTSAHTSHLVQQFLAKHSTAQLQQPPYSPHLAPCDIFPFPMLKEVLKGHRFEATEGIK
jgi:hypothetical protein